MNQIELMNPSVIENLQSRNSPYWRTLRYCRHIGVQKRVGKQPVWLGRIRTKTGKYRQATVGPVKANESEGLTYREALKIVSRWFDEPEVKEIASAAFDVGVNRKLRYSRSKTGFTVGDAMIDYVEWKRIAATEKNFLVLLSLVNHHIIPRLGNLQLSDLNGQTITAFCKDILETPALRGNQPPRPRMQISDLDGETLRKRKATVNTLMGILKLAVRMAWENGNTDDERCWRCIRRLPNYEAPRQLFLSRQECRLLIAECRTDLSDLVKAALYSGCRISELAELTCRDVGKDIFGLFVRTAKNRKSRYVYLPEEGMQFFLERCAGKNPDDLVFRTLQGHKWNGHHKHLFKAAVLVSGLPDSFVFHGLRHTYASQLVQAGTPLAIVARQLGHSNTDTVSRTYGHLSCTSIEQELERRFAPLGEHPAAPDPSLKLLRASLQAEPPYQPSRTWPDSNFSSFQGDFLKVLK